MKCLIKELRSTEPLILLIKEFKDWNLQGKMKIILWSGDHCNWILGFRSFGISSNPHDGIDLCIGYWHVINCCLINSRLEAVPTPGAYPKMCYVVDLRMRFPILYEELMIQHLWCGMYTLIGDLFLWIKRDA